MPDRRGLVIGSLLLSAATVFAVAQQGPDVSSQGPPSAGGPARESASPENGSLAITDAAPTFVVMPAGTPLELSGITWAGGDLFYAVSDNEPLVYPYDIVIDRNDGRIQSVTARPPIRPLEADGRPARGSDLEGVAYDPDSSTVTIADEGGLGDPLHSIRTFRTSDWRQIDSVSTAGTFFESGRVRGGLGLESLARNGTTIWTANEEALSGDGPRSSPDQGTTVRLTRLERGRLTGQFAYETEPTGGAFAYFNVHIGGVVDLVALDDGRLLVLERATFAAKGDDDLGGFVNHITLVEPESGTNIMGRPVLGSLTRGEGYQPVRKQVIWSRQFPLVDGPTNWEGMALGPLLADGGRSLILISDNDSLPSALWALKLVEGR